MPTYKGRVWYNETLRTLTLTEKDYKKWQNCIKMNDFFELADVKWTIVYSWDPAKIMDVQEVTSNSTEGKMFICDYWELHPLQDTCNCQKKYGMLWGTFQGMALEMFNVRYVKDLNNTQRHLIRQKYNEKLLNDTM